jgi:hypothetical protein
VIHPQNVRFQNIRFQNVRFQNVWNVVAEKTSIYILTRTCGWWKSAGSVAAMFAGKVMAVFYSLF